MLEIFLEPRQFMRRMGERPPLFELIFAYTILFAALSWAILSVNERAMSRLLADGVSQEVAEQSRRDLRREKLLRVVGAPVQILLDASATALAMFTGSRISGRSPPTRSMMSAAIAAEAPQLLSLATDLELLWNDGPEVTLDLRPLVRCSTSIAAFFPVSTQPETVRWAAEGITPFTIWSAVLAGIAFREFTDSSRKGAVGVFCLALLMRIALAATRPLLASELVL